MSGRVDQSAVPTRIRHCEAFTGEGGHGRVPVAQCRHAHEEFFRHALVLECTQQHGTAQQVRQEFRGAVVQIAQPAQETLPIVVVELLERLGQFVTESLVRRGQTHAQIQVRLQLPQASMGMPEGPDEEESPRDDRTPVGRWSELHEESQRFQRQILRVESRDIVCGRRESEGWKQFGMSLGQSEFDGGTMPPLGVFGLGRLLRRPRVGDRGPRISACPSAQGYPPRIGSLHLATQGGIERTLVTRDRGAPRPDDAIQGAIGRVVPQGADQAIDLEDVESGVEEAGYDRRLVGAHH